MGETELGTTTTSQKTKASHDLLTLSELFDYSIGAFTPLEMHYQDSLTRYLNENLEMYKLEGSPVVHATLDREKLITQAQLNRIWGRMKIKAFLPREYENAEELVQSWIDTEELHPIGKIEVSENVANVTLEVPLVYIR